MFFKLLFSLLFTSSIVLAATPTAPSNLVLKALSSTEVSISWKDNATNEKGFKIFRADKLVKMTKENVTSYVDKHLAAKTTYTYTVKATDEDPSLIKPTAPSNFHIVKTSKNSISLAWVDNAFNESAYLLYRNGSFIAALEPESTSFIDKSLKENSTYVYTLKAVNNLDSDIVTLSATTNLCRNGNFNGSASWMLYNDAFYDVNVSKDRGTGSIKLTTTNSDWQKRDNFHGAWDSVIPVEAGKTYTLSVSMKSDAGKSPSIFLYGSFSKADKTYTRNSIGEIVKNSSSEKWETFSITITPKKGEAFFLPKITMPANSSVGPLWIDQVLFIENESTHETNPDGSISGDVDSDDDGLSDAREAELGTNPNNSDSDGDGILDNEDTTPIGAVVNPTGAKSGLVDATAVVSEVVGTTKGSFSVSQGAASYNLDITVPPGRAGMQPKLSLNYNSNGGDGYLGKGWGIGGLSVITRCPSSKAVDGKIRAVSLDAQDNYCLDGQRLISIGDDEYKTEIDNFSKIVAHNSNKYGPAYWTVWTKGGLEYRYGYNDDADIKIGSASSFEVIINGKTPRAPTVTGSERIISWAVDTIKDKTEGGNNINFHYNNDNESERYIKSIDYKGGEILFDYDQTNRIKNMHGYIAGYTYNVTKRLDHIVIKSNESEVTRYNIKYKPAAQTSNSDIVSDITEVARHSPLSTLHFKWTDATKGFESGKTQVLEKINGATSSYHREYLQGDFNGDGLGDVIHVVNDVDMYDDETSGSPYFLIYKSNGTDYIESQKPPMSGELSKLMI